MLVESKTVDRIEVLADGTVQLRHRITITDDATGALRASHNHRQVIAPGGDLSGLDERTVRVIRAAWTPAVQSEPATP